MVNIGVPIRDLGEIDVSALLERVLSQEEEAWFENEHRQKAYDVHKQTSSIVMRFCDDEWPDITTFEDIGYDRLADIAQPMMDDILAKHYPPGGTILRAMAARLHPGGRIHPHVDKLPSFHAGHRIHIPLVTNKMVRFMIEGRPYKFEVGKVYEINNQLTHSVINNGKENRIHFIFDYVPPERAGKS